MTNNVELTIESLVNQGYGFSHLPDGKAVFVTGALPGEKILALITKQKKSCDFAHVEQVIEASPHRIKAPCLHAESCGGCPWQIFSYEQQLFWKRMLVVDALTRFGGENNSEELVAACEAPGEQWGYRNKVEFEVNASNKQLVVGLHERESTAITPIKHCLLLPEYHQDVPSALQGALRYSIKDLGLAPVRIGVRCSQRTKETEIALWTKPQEFPRAMVNRVVSQAAKNTSLVRVLFDGELVARDVKRVEVLGGKGCWRERVGDLEMSFSAPSFFQINTRGAEALVSLVLAALDTAGAQDDSRVLDLYCGAGTFTLPLAERFEDVCAVESVGSSLADLRRNLDTAGLYADVIGGDVARELPILLPADYAVIDPPRSGLSPQARATLAQSDLKGIIYVSCDPVTLSRDIKFLSESGYRIIEVTPIDLFPQSHHVECVVLMSREDK